MQTGLISLDLPPPFAADYLPPASAGAGGVDLVLAFSSVGHDPARMPEPEFLRIAPGSARARPVLFFRDQSRSWASAPEWGGAVAGAVAQIRARHDLRRIVALGVSMGAVSALRAGMVLPLDAVLAIGPQSDLAGEPRWQEWTAGRMIPPAELPPAPWVVLAHGMADDAAQALGFPLRGPSPGPSRGPTPGTVDHLLFEQPGHSDLGSHLKARGLAGMVDALVAGDRRRLLRIATAAGGQRRQEPR